MTQLLTQLAQGIAVSGGTTLAMVAGLAAIGKMEKRSIRKSANNNTQA